MTRKTFALIACCLISPVVATAQTGGLTRVQLLALQQELKEQCGLAHSTGVMDGPTRHAIAVCNKKYGTQGNGAALLTAMNVGFNTGENEPQHGMGSMMGNDHDMSMMHGDSAAHKKMMKGMKMAHDSAKAGRRDGRVRNPGQGKKTGKDEMKH